MVRMAECPKCGSQHDTTKAMKIHYGIEHEGSIAGVEAECTQCGESFRRKRSKLERADKPFCSFDCQAAWRSENFHGERNAAWKGGKVETECAICGEPLEVIQAKYEKYDRHFCSVDCRGVWFSENQSGSDHPNWKGKREHECANCGETVERYPRDDRHDRHFCDSQCLAKWRSRNWSADGRDRGKRGVYWQKQRHRAIERDDHECQKCGITRKEHREVYGRDLSVHHKQPSATFDTEEEAHTLDNLTTLCARCHRLVEPNMPTNTADEC